MKVGEVAELLGVTRACVYRWARRGVVPSLRIGGALRFERGAVLVAGVYRPKRKPAKRRRKEDFVDEVVAQRTAENIDFPAMVERARAKRRRR